jgi:adenylyltransferase/sulfurtransferase
MIDTRAMRFETLRYGWDEENPLNGRRSGQEEPTDAEVKIA